MSDFRSASIRLICVDKRVSRFAICVDKRVSRFAISARNSAWPALNWSDVTWSPCSTAARRASVRASAWAGVKSAAVSDRATACVSSIEQSSHKRGGPRRVAGAEEGSVTGSPAKMQGAAKVVDYGDDVAGPVVRLDSTARRRSRSAARAVASAWRTSPAWSPTAAATSRAIRPQAGGRRRDR